VRAPCRRTGCSAPTTGRHGNEYCPSTPHRGRSMLTDLGCDHGRAALRHPDRPALAAHGPVRRAHPTGPPRHRRDPDDRRRRLWPARGRPAPARLQRPLRGGERRTPGAVVLHADEPLVRPGRVAAALAADPRRVRGTAGPPPAPAPAARLRDGGRQHGDHVLLRTVQLRRTVPRGEPGTRRRPGAEPAAAAAPGDGRAPSPALRRLHRPGRTVRLRDRRTTGRPAGAGLAAGRPTLGPGGVGGADRIAWGLGRTRAGAATGRGTRWKTRRCCPG
jgi:hypothetical protein